MFLDQRSFLPQDVTSRQFNEASEAKEKSIFSISYPFFANSMALYRFRLVDHTFLSENDVSSVKANVRNSFFFIRFMSTTALLLNAKNERKFDQQYVGN